MTTSRSRSPRVWRARRATRRAPDAALELLYQSSVARHTLHLVNTKFLNNQVPNAYKGGATKTHLPQAGSPAIDGGTNACPAFDQRGIARPRGAACDVGAVEVEPAPACPDKPDKPILVKPTNGKKAKGPNIALDWNDANCATSYDVIVKLGATNGPKKFKQVNLAISQATTSALTKGQTYYWRVTAKNANGSAKSVWWSFKVK
ncbi:MAG: hypothetical protein HY741_13065 [Chloroflexi bacterium]|nr:hypothetical protein [Chloroflexota bacterium]